MLQIEKKINQKSKRKLFFSQVSHISSVEHCQIAGKLFNPVIWKEQVALVVGAASSRDHFISRLEAAPTGIFLW